jgi:PBP superfamily domain
VKKVPIIAAAATAAVACSSAFALTPTQITNDIAAATITTIYVSGSSAFRDEMTNALAAICQSGSLDIYGGDASGDSGNDPNTVRNAWDGYASTGAGPFYSYNGPDFRGYACTLVSPAPATAPDLANVTTPNILVYYRAEGGSVWGVWPLINTTPISALTIPDPTAVPAGQEACKNYINTNNQDNGQALGQSASNYAKYGPGGSAIAAGDYWVCSVPMPLLNTAASLTPPANGIGWWLPLDSAASWGASPPGSATAYPDPSDLQAVASTIGVSDVEPAILSPTYNNYPKNYKSNGGVSFGVTMPAGVTNLGVTPVLQQMFTAVLSSTGSATSGLTSLSRQSINGIFSGVYTNWQQVPESGVNAQITVCRRDPGSGTESVSQVYFLNQYCGQASKLEASTTIGALNANVLQYATTGDVGFCVGQGTNAIGIQNVGTGSAPSGGKFASINGQAWSQTALLTGAWEDWTDVDAIFPAAFSFTAPSGNAQNLAAGLVQHTADANSGAVKSATGYAYIPSNSAAGGGASDNTPTVTGGGLAKFIAVGDKGGKTCYNVTQPLNTN